jgi:hypothetical protein
MQLTVTERPEITTHFAIILLSDGQYRSVQWNLPEVCGLLTHQDKFTLGAVFL